jgi:hypothetical protein
MSTGAVATNGDKQITTAVSVGQNGAKYCWPIPANIGHYLLQYANHERFTTHLAHPVKPVSTADTMPGVVRHGCGRRKSTVEAMAMVKNL